MNEPLKITPPAGAPGAADPTGNAIANAIVTNLGWAQSDEGMATADREERERMGRFAQALENGTIKRAKGGNAASFERGATNGDVQPGSPEPGDG